MKYYGMFNGDCVLMTEEKYEQLKTFERIGVVSDNLFIPESDDPIAIDILQFIINENS